MTVKPLLLGFSLLAVALPPARAAESCADADVATVPARLSGFDAAGDPQLADGRALRLIGLAPRQNAADDARFRAGIAPYLGREILLAIAGETDRWGRWPARLFVEAVPDGGRQDIAQALVKGGAALPMPEPQAASCVAPPTVRTEPAAALQLLPPPAVDGHDLAAVRRQEGRYVMLEGRIASVGARSRRTYLNFSRKPREAASIVMSRRLWRELEEAGWTAAGLGGKRLRAYGVLSGRDGLLLEVTSRAALEVID